MTKNTERAASTTVRLDTKSGRARLAPRAAPYFKKLSTGRYLGLRKHAGGTGTWVARFRTEAGAQEHKPLGELCFDSDTSDRIDAYDEAKAHAELWFKEIERGVTGRSDDGRPLTVGAICTLYVEDRRKQKGEGTSNDYHRAFQRSVYGGGGKDDKRHSPNQICEIHLSKLRTRQVREWRDSAIAAGTSKSTSNRMLTRLRAALNFAVSERYVSADAAREWRDVQPFEGVSKRRSLYMDLTERRALLKAAQGAVRDLIEAAMVTGARPGELVSARRSAFDARTRAITFTGKTGTRETVLSPAAVTLFERLAKNKLPSAYLLTRDDGKPWAHSDWDELVRDAAAKAELPKGTVLYTCRHSWITQAITEGMSALEVARLVGTSLAMIDKNYGHLAQSAARERLAKVTMV
jgi:integrase